MFRFLHTADIHLDSPLKGLEVHEDAPVEDRCPDDYIELSLKGIKNSTKKFCNYILWKE